MLLSPWMEAGCASMVRSAGYGRCFTVGNERSGGADLTRRLPIPDSWIEPVECVQGAEYDPSCSTGFSPREQLAAWGSLLGPDQSPSDVD